MTSRANECPVHTAPSPRRILSPLATGGSFLEMGEKVIFIVQDGWMGLGMIDPVLFFRHDLPVDVFFTFDNACPTP